MVDVNSPIENEQREQDAILALGSLRGNLSSSSISPLDLSTADNSRDLSRRSSAALTPFEGPSPWTSTTSLHSLQDPNIPDARFFDRVSHLPYIASAVRAYELGRNSSRVVKYGTDLMESSVYALSNRMVGQERMDQLEHFACRQLNRFSPHAGEHTLSPEPPTKEPSDADAAVTDIAEDNKAQEPEHHLEPLSIRKRKRSLSTRCREDDHKVQVPTHDENEPEENVAALDRSPSPNTTRRRWQTMLLEAGGLSAAVSEESLKSLQFCLNRLSYTTALLQDRIAFLRSFMLSLSTDPSNQDGIDPTHLETLQRIKMDLVDGVKHSVDAVSKYAGGALPDQAKQFVRKTLLSLPSRFNTSLQQQQRRPSRSDGSVSEQRQALHDAAERMLTFAVEGVDALGSVAKVFGDTIERADGWLHRMRMLGINPQRPVAEGQSFPQLLQRSEEAPIDEESSSPTPEPQVV